MLSLQEKHEKCLYPEVRVQAEGPGAGVRED